MKSLSNIIEYLEQSESLSQEEVINLILDLKARENQLPRNELAYRLDKTETSLYFYISELHRYQEALEFYALEARYKTPLDDENDLNNRGIPFPDKGHKARDVLSNSGKSARHTWLDYDNYKNLKGLIASFNNVMQQEGENERYYTKHEQELYSYLERFVHDLPMQETK